MNKFCIRTLKYCPLMALVLNIEATMAGNMYKWVDEYGNVQFTDSIPPDAVNLSREIINADGLTTEIIEKAKTPEEVRKEQENAHFQAESQRLKAEQEAADQVLLRTFRTEDDILMALNGKLDAISIQVKVAQNSVRRYQTKLANQQYKQAAALELAAKTVPASLKEQIQDTLKRINDTYLIIRQKQQEQQAIRDAFERDIKRFRILRKLTNDQQVVEESIPTFLENLLPCKDGSICDEMWIKAEAFVLKYATTAIQIQGEFIIMTKAPIHDDDISITISKIRHKDQPTMLFMDLFCKSSPKGSELCGSAKVEAIRHAYRQDVGGIKL